MHAGSIHFSHSFRCCFCVYLEVSAKFKEDRIARETDEKPSASEAASTSHRRDETKHIGPKEKVLNLITGAEDGTSRKSKVGRYSAKDDNVVSEPKQQPESTNNSKKRKNKSFSTSQVTSEYFDCCTSNLDFMTKSIVPAADFKSRSSNGFSFRTIF